MFAIKTITSSKALFFESAVRATIAMYFADDVRW